MNQSDTSISKRIGRWLRGAKDRRSSARFSIPTLCMYCWDGGAPAPHEILDISETGAYFVTAARWGAGTLLGLTIRESSNSQNLHPDSPLVLMVRSQVVRVGTNGLGVRFLHTHPRERRQLRRLLEDARRGDASVIQTPKVPDATVEPEASDLGEPVQEDDSYLDVPYVAFETCNQHGLDPDAFVAMLREFAPQRTSGPEFTKLLMACIEWLPALTSPARCSRPRVEVVNDAADPAEPGRTQSEDALNFLDLAINTCIQHGLDPDAFVAMMQNAFGVSISEPRKASEAELMRFLRAVPEWSCPPSTPLIERRRAEARAKWAQISPPEGL